MRNLESKRVHFISHDPLDLYQKIHTNSQLATRTKQIPVKTSQLRAKTLTTSKHQNIKDYSVSSPPSSSMLSTMRSSLSLLSCSRHFDSCSCLLIRSARIMRREFATSYCCFIFVSFSANTSSSILMKGRPVTRGRFLMLALERLEPSAREALDLAEEAFFVLGAAGDMAWVWGSRFFIIGINGSLFLVYGDLSGRIWNDLWDLERFVGFGTICGIWDDLWDLGRFLFVFCIFKQVNTNNLFSFRLQCFIHLFLHCSCQISIVTLELGLFFKIFHHVHH